MELVDKVKNQLIKNGYSLDLDYSVPNEFLWSPDFVCTKDGYTYYVLIRSNNTVPQSYLSRMSVVLKDKVVPLIVFSRKITKLTETSILSNGLSYCYYINGKLSHLTVQKKVSKREAKKEIRNKLRSIDIFVSSRQKISEREFIRGRIEYLRDVFYYPFFPHLIEYDSFDIAQLHRHIDKTLNECDWIVLLLEDEYSDVVHYEINAALDSICHDNIFMFVKSSRACADAWKKDLDKVKGIESKSIKYLPFTDTFDLEVTFTKAVRKRMNKICKSEGVELFEG